jgi:NAD(P)H-hydrate repair Nnr-like enzyme with NAD(P)H-hydrate epimerase domain
MTVVGRLGHGAAGGDGLVVGMCVKKHGGGHEPIVGLVDSPRLGPGEHRSRTTLRARWSTYPEGTNSVAVG